MPIKITETNFDIQKKINKALAKDLNLKFNRLRVRINNEIKKAAYNWVSSQPEISSLLDEGSQTALNAQFGFYPSQASQIITNIINSIVQSTDIKINRINDKLKGGLSINFQPSSFANLLGNSSYDIITEKGVVLNWLDWLLTRGDEIIVIGYTFVPSGAGRSKSGSMKAGSGFRVSPQFSGTVDDNFITRAFSGREQEINLIISRLLNV